MTGFFNRILFRCGLENVCVLAMRNAKKSQTDEQKIGCRLLAGVDLGYIKNIRYRVKEGKWWKS